MIETARLWLRPFKMDDALDVFAYLKEPRVHCFASMKLNGLEEAKALMATRMKDPEYCLAIVLKDNGKVIGEIEAHPEKVAPEQIEADTFSPCWMLHEAYQGKGYAYEAAAAFFEELFLHQGTRRIYTYVEQDNLPSQSLCERLGMRLEGEFIEFVSFVRDEKDQPIYENTRQYALLKKEWLARIKSKNIDD